MLLKEKIKSFLQKAEPFRFYILRFVRVYLMYYLYIVTTELCTIGLGENDPEKVNYNPLQYNGSACVSVLLVFIFVCGLFVLYDPTARRHFAKNPPKEKNLFSEWGHVFRTYEFWCDIVGLAILPLVLKTEIFVHPLWLFFGRDDFSEMGVYVRYLLTILPILSIIELIMRVRTRRFWRKMTKNEAKEMHFDGLKLCFLSLLVIIGLPFISRFYITMLFYIIIAVFLPTTLLGIAAILLLLWLFASIRALNIRRKFILKLKKVCKAENIEISEIKRPYLSVFLRKNHDFQFTVKRGGKTYACKMIAAISKGAQMVFLDEDTGYFKFGFQFRNCDIVFLRLKFYHSFEATNADKNIYIISPVPYEICAVTTQIAFQSEGTDFVTESKRIRILDNASAIYDSTLFSGEGFLSALKRNCLDKSEL